MSTPDLPPSRTTVELLRQLAEARAEIERLRERLGPVGLEVVEIDGAGHYVNVKVKAEIERLTKDNANQVAACKASRAENERLRAERDELKSEQINLRFRISELELLAALKDTKP